MAKSSSSSGDLHQRRDQDRVQQRDVLLKKAERLASMGHWEWDYVENRLVSCSDGFARIYGLTIDQTLEVQSSWESMILQIHPEDRERYQRTGISNNDGDSYEVEYRIIRSDGEIRHVYESGAMQIKADGERLTAFGLLQDITDRKRYQQELENRDALARQVESVAEIGHFIFNLETETYIYISAGFARIHGVEVDEYMSMVDSREDDMEDVHPDDYDRLMEVYSSHRNDGTDFNVEYRIFRADGALRWIREQGTSVCDPNLGIVQSIGVLQDITEQKQIEQNLRETRDSLEAIVKKRTRKLVNTVKQLEAEISEREKIAAELDFLANHDALTGLPSLRLCKDRLDRSLAEARRTRQASAVMFLDLDGFKEINDSHSHDVGDQVLKVTADRITAEIRETDTVARIGGDEFVIILSGVPEIDIVKRIASSLIDSISQPIRIEQIEVTVSGSIGIAIYPDDGQSAEQLIRVADRAMYDIKAAGKNDFGFATPELKLQNFS